jgi:hypothetical protein
MDTIDEIEEYFKSELDLIRNKKSTIEINEEFIVKLTEIYNNESITSELWIGLLFYLNQYYTFDLDKFKNDINQMIEQSAKTDKEDYKIIIDASGNFQLNILNSIQNGGGNIYYNKYLKYKKKYLKKKLIKYD